MSNQLSHVPTLPRQSQQNTGNQYKVTFLMEVKENSYIFTGFEL